MQSFEIEHVLIDCRKTKTEVIVRASQNKQNMNYEGLTKTLSLSGSAVKRE